jgi:hypothetical protein
MAANLRRFYCPVARRVRLGNYLRRPPFPALRRCRFSSNRSHSQAPDPPRKTARFRGLRTYQTIGCRICLTVTRTSTDISWKASAIPMNANRRRIEQPFQPF